MELAVLLKAVPPSELLRVDPARRAVVRHGVELVLNAFDQRALRVALELRRPGETVTAIALGPPGARPVLVEALALGADHAIQLCDAGFGGSDVLATSVALASILRRQRAGLVLAGARSTDSDTGLVGPEVAGRLGIPVVSFARAVRRPADAEKLEAEVDTPTGRATVEATFPLLLTVGEKVCKPLHVTPEQLERARTAPVETLGPDGLGLTPEEVGASGSPTQVEAVREAAPTRLGRKFSAPDLHHRVSEALAELGPLLGRPEPVPPPLPEAVSGPGVREVVVLVSGPEGGIDVGSYSVLTHLRHELPRHRVTVAVYGRSPEPAETRRLAGSGASGGYLMASNLPFDSGDVAAGLPLVLDRRPGVDALVCLSSPFGKEVAGQLAAFRNLGAVGDATAVREDPVGTLAWSKPSFGGTTVATIRSRTTPTVVTMPPALSPAATDDGVGRPFSWTALHPPTARGRVRRLSSVEELPAGPDVGGAEVVVGVGMGLGGPEALATLLPVVERWGAALVGTRRVVDAGWIPSQLQLGLTGRSLAPRLAILLGVRGAAYHMVGWSRARAVLAVNRDPEAPVFLHADVGIVGSVEEVVPELAEPLALALGRPPRP